MAKSNERPPRYYLDSSVLIHFIEHVETDELVTILVPIIEDAKKGRFDLVTSTLTIAEVLYGASERKQDGSGVIDPEIERKINLLWHPGTSPIRLVDVHELIAKEAMQLFRSGIPKGWFKTGGCDAIHLVTARHEMVDEFFTTENAAKKWESEVGFTICPPHYDPPPKPLEPPRNLFENLASSPAPQ
jgi:predicted nucleic acid-binding protein